MVDAVVATARRTGTARRRASSMQPPNVRSSGTVQRPKSTARANADVLGSSTLPRGAKKKNLIKIA
jgi:hypothetical protein